MKNFLGLLVIVLFYSSQCFSDGHKVKFKDIKGFKKQFISMSEKKINRIKEVKRSDGFPVYEGKTSIEFTVNREDAGCGKGKAKTSGFYQADNGHSIDRTPSNSYLATRQLAGRQRTDRGTGHTGVHGETRYRCQARDPTRLGELDARC